MVINPGKILAGTLTLLIFMILFIVSFPAVGNDSLIHVLAKSERRSQAAILNNFAGNRVAENPEEGIGHAREALKIAREFKNFQEEARALCILGDGYYYLNDQQQAIKFYLESAEVEKETGGAESEKYASRIGDAGYCYYASGHHPDALRLMQESLELSLHGGYENQAASMYCNIGNIYTIWGEYHLALEHYQKALEIDRKLKDPIQIATDLNNIGKVYEQWAKYHDAIRYYMESLELAKMAGNQAMVAVRLNNIAIVYKAWQKYPESLEYFQQALDIERSQGNTEKVGRRLFNIALTYLAMKSYDKCLAYLNEAAPLVVKSGSEDDLARFYNIYAKYYLATNDYHRSIEKFQQSQLYAIKNNLRPLQIGNLQGLAEALEKAGNHSQALKTLKQFILIKDSVFTAESDIRLSEFQARYENDKMRMENEVLKKDAKIKRDLYLLSGIASFTMVVILISIILILRLKARNARQAKRIAEQLASSLTLELELKNKELTCNAMSIIKKNEAFAGMIEAIEKAIRDGEPAAMVNTIVDQIRNGDREKSWNEFEVRFIQVHKDFYDKLNAVFPDLSPNERKLCAFLRLNMTSKDIASITHQSVHSINVARTRLRRKMNLANSDENLVSFLTNL